MAAYVDSTGVTNLTADIKALADQTYVNNVQYDSTNKKITKTIGSTTTDIVNLGSAFPYSIYCGTCMPESNTSEDIRFAFTEFTGPNDFTNLERGFFFVQFTPYAWDPSLTKKNYIVLTKNGGSYAYEIRNNSNIDVLSIRNTYYVFYFNGYFFFYLDLNADAYTRDSIYDAMTNVTYDTTNQKLVQTSNGTSNDIVSVTTLKHDMELSDVSFLFVKTI